MNAILENFGKVKFENFPYSHFVLDNFLPSEFFERLKSEFPTDEEFHRLNDDFYGAEGRLDIEKESKMYRYLIENSKTWREFADVVNSADFFQFFLKNWWPIAEENGIIPIRSKAKLVNRVDGTQSSNKNRLYNSAFAFFRDYGFRSFYRKLKRIFAPDTFFSVLNIARMVPGYTVYPHTDNRYKAVVLLLYLDEIQEEGGEFVIHSYSAHDDLSKCPQYPSDDQLEDHLRVKPKENRLVGLINCNNAYHSTTDWTFGQRRMVYISIARANYDSTWESQLNEPGDVGKNHVKVIARIFNRLGLSRQERI